MMRVLVVDGDRDLRAFLVSLLGAMGNGAAAVGSLEALSRRVARRAPDAVLCDATPPDGDGIETCRRLKLLRPDLMVVIMAWNPAWAARARRVALGPVLCRPFSPPELMHAMTSVIFSRLKTTLSTAVSDLITQDDQVRAQFEDLKTAAAGKREEWRP